MSTEALSGSHHASRTVMSLASCASLSCSIQQRLHCKFATFIQSPHAMQVHTVGELERVLQLKLDGCMLGINNRDLGTFKVDLNNNKLIMDSAPGQQVCCTPSQSGLARLSCCSGAEHAVLMPNALYLMHLDLHNHSKLRCFVTSAVHLLCPDTMSRQCF